MPVPFPPRPGATLGVAAGCGAGRGGPAGAGDREAGVTLMEVMVAMGIMTVVTALFGAGMTYLYRSANRGEALGIAQTQAHTAFVRLDREIRYASGISEPGQASGNWYVEYAIDNTGVVTCTQLRLVSGSGLLQSRTRRGSGPISGWSTLASYVTTPRHFARTLASASGAPHQQLGVTLTLQAGRGATASRRQASFTFTALNTSVDTPPDGVCTGMARS